MRLFRLPRPAALALALLVLSTAACGGATPVPGGDAQDRIPRHRSVDRYVAMLEAPTRAHWQRPDELIAALEIAPGSTVADVGTGSGYFLPQLQAAVGLEGRVVAQDIDPELVEHVRGRIARERLSRVEARLGRAEDPNLEAATYDLVLMVDVYHHVADPPTFLAHILRSLRPGGRLVIADFAPGDHVPEAVSGSDHRITPQRVMDDARMAGLTLRRDHDALTYQFMLEFDR